MRPVPVFTVHEPPSPPSSRIEHALSLRFIKDGFSWGAALVPLLWFIYRGYWVGFAAYVVLATVLASVLSAAGAEPDWIMLALLTLNIIVGFEATEFERWWRTMRGWREIGAISGRSRSQCERRFFESWLPTVPDVPASPGGPPPPSPWAAPTQLAHDYFARLRGLVGART